ncbi:histidine kinase [Micromonospora sp. DH14]|uniref:sensor histidine kinase n=1 Tax=Micromonospora sp. DH14 TaxID=3040120 RepID=UPI0024415BFD|nr:histidine kinase [Micromonospora sp. DH14]MDG9676094.1 histidine kinase [Micromonospora sp. DH14]
MPVGRPYAGSIIISRLLNQVLRWSRRRSMIDGVAAFAMAVCVVTGQFGVDFFGPTLAGFGPGLPPLWLGISLGLAVGLLTWRRRQAPTVLLAGALAATALVSAQATVVLALYTLAERTRAWPKVAVSVLVSVVLVGTPIWRYAGADGAIPVTVAVCVAPAFLGLYVGTRRELVERIRERAERLEREQHQRVAQARSDERAHIARDMHDVVAHRVALIVLQATALESAGGEDAVARGRQIGAIGREALTEVRALVGILRSDDDAPLAPHPGLADLHALVEVSRRLGVPVTLDLEKETGERLPLLVEHAAYRIVQESLTNVHKHAPGARTRIRIRQTRQSLRVTISNGRGRPSTAPALPVGGHGLLGLAERVHLIGGELASGPTTDGGFSVAAEIPISPGKDNDLTD